MTVCVCGGMDPETKAEKTIYMDAYVDTHLFRHKQGSRKLLGTGRSQGVRREDGGGPHSWPLELQKNKCLLPCATVALEEKQYRSLILAGEMLTLTVRSSWACVMSWEMFSESCVCG